MPISQRPDATHGRSEVKCAPRRHEDLRPAKSVALAAMDGISPASDQITRQSVGDASRQAAELRYRHRLCWRQAGNRDCGPSLGQARQAADELWESSVRGTNNNCAPARTMMRKALIGLVRGYRLVNKPAVSGHAAATTRPAPPTPLQAMRLHGPVRIGGWLALKRLATMSSLGAREGMTRCLPRTRRVESPGLPGDHPQRGPLS